MKLIFTLKAFVKFSELMNSVSQCLRPWGLTDKAQDPCTVFFPLRENRKPRDSGTADPFLSKFELTPYANPLSPLLQLSVNQKDCTFGNNCEMKKKRKRKNLS